ncbi:MAG TPA: hypothetical protein VJ867_11390 [Gemmatimonadaceae bacterium]|nr:hypothetical protein [Gemmatimonadaceae bacterium]
METLVHGSHATSEFKAAVLSYLEGKTAERVKVESFVPRVKVRRLLTQLLHAEPALEIDEIVVRGSSGCSDFVGSVDVRTTSGTHAFDFVWDCRWRAEHEGYVDHFGYPDQMRAAMEFDWQCFQQWVRRNDN